MLEKATAQSGGSPTLSVRSDTQQRWLGEEVQVEAAEEEVAVEMAPVVGVTEVVEVLAIEPDQLRLGS